MNKALPAILISLLASQIAGGKVTAPQARSSARKTQSNSSSPPKKYYKNLKMQADQISDAVIQGDYAKAADLTYPKLVELLGGRAKYLAILEQAMKEMRSETSRVLSNVADEPQDIIKVKNQIYAIVPTTMKIKVPEGLLVGRGFMIGVSKDGGENWTFVDSGGNEFDRGRLRILFPAAADKLRLPKIEPPVLQPDSTQ